MRAWRWYSKLLLALLLAVLAWFVWPTPWRYFTSEGIRVRQHRITGATECYEVFSGWEEDRQPPAAPSSFREFEEREGGSPKAPPP